MLAVLLLALGAGGCEPRPGTWVEIPAGACRVGSRDTPAHPPHAFATPGFRLGRCEVTVREFCAYLSASGSDWRDGHPQVRGAPGHWRPARGQARRPITGLDRSEASAYCRWLSSRLGVPARLPDPQEWEYAARGGRTDVRYPWGWGSPAGRAVFDATSPAPVGSAGAYGFGLCDMAGNVFEWCRGGGNPDAGEVRGGSWAERDVASLTVYRSVYVDPDYRDGDVGFRVLLETLAAGDR